MARRLDTRRMVGESRFRQSYLWSSDYCRLSGYVENSSVWRKGYVMASVVDEIVTQERDVQAPLARLAGTIRRYVILDTLLAVSIFLACWFWLGLAADFGS